MSPTPDPDVLAQAAADAEATRDRPETAAAARRARTSADPATVYSVRIPVAMIEQLRVFAETRGTTPSALLREWVIERLNNETSSVATGTDQLQATAAYLADVAHRLDTMTASTRKAS